MLPASSATPAATATAASALAQSPGHGEGFCQALTPLHRPYSLLSLPQQLPTKRAGGNPSPVPAASQQGRGSERSPRRACLPQGSQVRHGPAGSDATLRWGCCRSPAQDAHRGAAGCLPAASIPAGLPAPDHGRDFWGSNPTQTDFLTVTAQGHPGALGLPSPSPGSAPSQTKAPPSALQAAGPPFPFLLCASQIPALPRTKGPLLSAEPGKS